MKETDLPTQIKAFVRFPNDDKETSFYTLYLRGEDQYHWIYATAKKLNSDGKDLITIRIPKNASV